MIHYQGSQSFRCFSGRSRCFHQSTNTSYCRQITNCTFRLRVCLRSRKLPRFRRRQYFQGPGVKISTKIRVQLRVQPWKATGPKVVKDWNAWELAMGRTTGARAGGLHFVSPSCGISSVSVVRHNIEPQRVGYQCYAWTEITQQPLQSKQTEKKGGQSSADLQS
jgi:hypothetical protein